MAVYMLQTRARNFTKNEKKMLDTLWDTGEPRGVGRYYSPAIERAAAQLGRSVADSDRSKQASWHAMSMYASVTADDK